MNTYSHTFTLDSGPALARALGVYLGLGDKLVALKIQGGTAVCTFEQVDDAPAVTTTDTVNATRLAARPPANNFN